MIMDKKEKNFATYKEFAKMLREVANIYSKLGDEPLLKEGYEYNACLLYTSPSPRDRG